MSLNTTHGARRPDALPQWSTRDTQSEAFRLPASGRAGPRSTPGTQANTYF